MGKNELQKNIGLVAALSIVVGMVIGGGVFFKPTAVFSATGAPGLGIIAWILGGIITITAGLTAAELGAAIPKTGGMVTYLKEIYGDTVGYLLGWALTVVYFPAVVAALGIIFATQVVNLMGLDPELTKIIGIATIILLATMNSLGGSKAGAMIQTVATAGKLIPLIAIIIIGFLKGEGGTANLIPMVSADHPVASGLGSALVATMFAYDGWISVGTIAGEMKNPAKDLPKAIVGGLSLVMAVYVIINIAYLYVLPASVLAETETPAADVARIIFGANGGKIITVGILVSIFGALNGNILTGPRVPYTLGIENKLPASEWFAKLTNGGSPANSILFVTILSILYVFSGKFNQLTDLIVFIMWLFYVIIFAGVFILRKKQPDLPRPYKVPLYPIVPAIAIFGGVYIIFNTLVSQPLNAGLGLGATLIGLPIYMSRKSKIKHS